jgi:uncharacterized protein YjbI with pentapeptide repeats
LTIAPNLTGADLYGADLYDAKLAGALWPPEAVPEGWQRGAAGRLKKADIN